ncbi:MAG: hypothetical protein V4486_01150 [Patescibacteria group bacterium]
MKKIFLLVSIASGAYFLLTLLSNLFTSGDASFGASLAFTVVGIPSLVISIIFFYLSRSIPHQTEAPKISKAKIRILITIGITLIIGIPAMFIILKILSPLVMNKVLPQQSSTKEIRIY